MMLTYLECFPCFLKQTVIALNLKPYPAGLAREIMRGVCSIMEGADTSKPPAYTTTFIHRYIRDRLGEDPYAGIKHDYNRLALGLYPGLKDLVSKGSDRLWKASRLAIAGNIIDFGIFTSIDIEGSLLKALETEIAVDDYQSFREAIESADRVMYLLDNAGEIVFDRLLIEELALLGKKVTAVVKGSPVLNDATIDDAREAGITGLCDVIDNGSDAIGTIIEWTSPGFQREAANAELIISKGQGNFETLTGTEQKKAYFLFQAKCDVVSKELDVPPGSMLLKKS